MKSIIQDDKSYCFLCQRTDEPLDCHHIFEGPLRNASEQYGLKVYLCHNRCHIFGENSVHVNHDVDTILKKYAQSRAMEKYKWDVDEFRTHFRKNYLEE